MAHGCGSFSQGAPGMTTLALHPQQMLALKSPATEILYGGAMGGGKSYLLRAVMIALCYDNQGLQAYLFRRTYPSLIENHLHGHMSFPAMLADMVDAGQCKIV